MNAVLGLALFLVPIFQGLPEASAQDPDLRVVSSNGAFSARIARAPGQERVAERLARWLVTVRSVAADPTAKPLWSCHYPGLPEADGHHLLSDDGTTFVAVRPDYQPARPVVHVFRFGEQIAEYVGRDIDLERGEFTLEVGRTRWLADEDDHLALAWHERLHGPSLVLEFESARGWTRQIDLTQGGLLDAEARPTPVLSPGVDPRLRGVMRIPRVDSFWLPELALAGVPVVMAIDGTHPTTNWQLCGFQVEVLDAAGFELRIIPQTRPPTPGTLAGQAITAYRGEATMHGLLPGQYLIHVQGSEAQEYRLAARTLVVLPSRVRAKLRVTGGIMGIDDRIELFLPGVLRITSERAGPDAAPRYLHLSPERLDSVNGALLALALESPRTQKTTHAADLFQYDLQWWAGDAWRQVGRDDGTARGRVGELINALQRGAL